MVSMVGSLLFSSALVLLSAKGKISTCRVTHLCAVMLFSVTSTPVDTSCTNVRHGGGGGGGIKDGNCYRKERTMLLMLITIRTKMKIIY